MATEGAIISGFAGVGGDNNNLKDGEGANEADAAQGNNNTNPSKMEADEVDEDNEDESSSEVDEEGGDQQELEGGAIEGDGNDATGQSPQGIEQRRRLIKIKDNLKKMQNNFLEWKIGINYESEPVHSSQDDILRPRIEAAEEEIRLEEERQFRQLQFGMVYKFKR